MADEEKKYKPPPTPPPQMQPATPIPPVTQPLAAGAMNMPQTQLAAPATGAELGQGAFGGGAQYQSAGASPLNPPMRAATPPPSLDAMQSMFAGAQAALAGGGGGGAAFAPAGGTPGYSYVGPHGEKVDIAPRRAGERLPSDSRPPGTPYAPPQSGQQPTEPQRPQPPEPPPAYDEPFDETPYRYSPSLASIFSSLGSNYRRQLFG